MDKEGGALADIVDLADQKEIKLVLDEQIKENDQETFVDTARHLLPSAREGENTAREGQTSGRRSTRARRLSVVDEFSLPSLNEPRKYVSRRGKVFDDTDSEGEDDPNNPRFLDTGVIKYRDT